MTRGARLLDFDPPCFAFAKHARAAGWTVTAASSATLDGLPTADVVLARNCLRRSVPQEHSAAVRKLLRRGGTLAVLEFDVGPYVYSHPAALPAVSGDDTYLWSVESLTRLFGPHGIGAPFGVSFRPGYWSACGLGGLHNSGQTLEYLGRG